MKPIEPIKLLTGKERTKFINKLNEQFGIDNIKGNLIKRGKERVFLFEGNLGKKQIDELSKATFVERVGVYLAKEEEMGIRLSIEGSQILKNKITKNIIELTKKEMQTWMMGHEVLRKNNFTGFAIIKYKDDMLGTGKASEEKITNFIPKSRRLKDKTIEQ
jgi:NOL1/NOP2/fmu family ribosome biogenesis protein